MIKHKWIRLFCVMIFLTGCRDHKPIVSLFPLEKYDQHLSNWIKPIEATYDQPLMTQETQRHLDTFYKHTFGTASPWSAEYVNKILHAPKPDDLKSTELNVIQVYSNPSNKAENEVGYGENFHPYSLAWTQALAKNINTAQFDHLHYDPHNRAIAIENLNARLLPTDDVFFYSHTLAGQGYPFDNLQISALWAGSPVYVIGHTQDQAWSFIMTADYIAWVKSSGLAHVDESFVKTWKTAALKHSAAIIHSQTSVINTQHHYRFTTYVGAVFPAEEFPTQIKIMVPIADTQQNAKVDYALLSKDEAAIIPLAATPHNFARVMSTLLGRPYGWGNLYFYNDCSSELKSLFTPFGIWLPRHSSEQVYVGKWQDLSAEPLKQRLSYLMEKGRRFSTLIYVGGHVVLFIGNYPNPNSTEHKPMPLTFQNMWGLSPHPSTRRAIIGKSVLFPLLESYPEDRSLVSQAGKDIFQISQLDESPTDLMKLEIIDLKSLMNP